MKLRKLLTLTVVVAVIGIGFGTTTAQAKQQNCVGIHQGINYYRHATHGWQLKLGVRITRASKLPIRSCQYARWVANVWRNRATALRARHERIVQQKRERERKYLALYGKWACIHSHEGAWDSNTGNGYYGGLQMDIQFQLSHGRQFYNMWGTANNWPVWAQLAAAEDAYRTRGFNPWPNTARACGQL